MPATTANSRRYPRVVVTGLGCVTPLGVGVSVTWKGLLAGQSGIATVEGFDSGAFASRIAGQCRGFDPEKHFETRRLRHLDRYSQLAIVAAREAFDHARLGAAPAIPERIGVYLGSGIGGLATMEEGCKTLFERGPRRMQPYFVPMVIPNMAAAETAIELGAKGPNLSHSTACASGAHAIGEALWAVRSGRAEIMLAGGTEAAVTPLGLAGFAALRALSKRNDEPEKASRPFDKDRDGFVLAEGAAALVLESLESARGRGAQIQAELIGFGASCDAGHITQPDVNGAISSMRNALADAGISPEGINYINAHGTSTPLGDVSETRAIKEIFGKSAPPVSSIKSMVGHSLGAAGAIEAVASVLAAREGIAPPTINLDNQDPECDLDYIPNCARRVEIGCVLSNSFGFGGTNATLIFKRYSVEEP